MYLNFLIHVLNFTWCDILFAYSRYFSLVSQSLGVTFLLLNVLQLGLTRLFNLNICYFLGFDLFYNYQTVATVTHHNFSSISILVIYNLCDVMYCSVCLTASLLRLIRIQYEISDLPGVDPRHFLFEKTKSILYE